MSKIDFPIDSFQAILFDFDGVLVECMDVKTEAFAQLFKPYGKEVVKKVIDHHIKFGGISRYKKIKYYYNEYLNKKISDDELNKLAKKFSDLVVNKVIASEWVNGVKDFLEKYFQKIDLYVISGTPEEELKLIVNKRGMDKYFKGVFGSPITKPEHISRIILKNNYDQDKVLYVGDSLSDYHDSQKVQVRFLGRIPQNGVSIFIDSVPVIRDFLAL